MNDDLPTHIWVEAKMREAHACGTPAFVINKGNKTGGMVLVKSNNLKGLCRIYTRQRDLDGVLTWGNILGGDVDEAKADEFIRAELNFDEDLWVIEVEDPDLGNIFEEK